ncbi:MAG: hypothetical protein KFF77_07730 [Bacteroidetes bacterium]|nr:hypothetical protein [Bacteroidota bacterium]
MEERRKQATGKRPYRCHVCGHRGWFDETALRFPSSAQKPLAPGVAGKDVPVPDLQLDDIEPLSIETKKAGSPADSAGEMSRATVNGEEAFSVPEFANDVGSPVSVKVSPAFHHHARNKSHACPACGEFALYRSRARHFGERLRKRLSQSRPFRCHRCGWRGWMQRK